MNAQDFEKTWSEFAAERRELISRRTDLENELVEVRKKIAHLDAVMEHLAPLANISWNEDIIGLGITDAIRRVLQTWSGEKLSAKDIQQNLIDRGYDLSEFSAPMASIYKILSRLEDSKEIEREKEGYKVFFKWKSPISDEDIPF